MFRIHTVADIPSNTALLRAKRYGVIETSAGALQSITLRPWPHVLSLRELWPVGDRYHAAGPADRCRLYYNQPRGSSQFLALKYVVTTRGTSYRTFRAALEALDQIAELKGTDAILCDAANRRLSDRFLRRQGYVPHAPMPWRRNYIRRLYEERAAAPA
ncbi:MAG: hypothetical protein AAGJ46_15430 [Planctomycetota bacterium]